MAQKLKNFPKKIILEAIKGSHGNVSVVAGLLHVDWKTAKRNIERFEETKTAMQNEVETIGDFIEAKAVEACNRGSESMIRYMLSTKYRNRGYEQNPVLKIDNQEPLNITFDGITKQDLEAADNVEINNAE